MKKIRTLSELQEMLDIDFNARRNELTYFKKVVEDHKGKASSSVFTKQFIVLMYSHWEGFIKFACDCLIQFASQLKLRNYQLNFGLFSISKLNKIQHFIDSKVSLKIKILEEIFIDYEGRSSIPNDYSVSTYSNLNHEVLSELCLIIGIEFNYYSTKKGIIDEKLLNKRNLIAHGDLIRIDYSEGIDAFDLIFPILENFKSDILNRAVFLKNAT